MLKKFAEIRPIITIELHNDETVEEIMENFANLLDECGFASYVFSRPEIYSENETE